MAGRDVARQSDLKDPGPTIALAAMGLAIASTLAVWGCVSLGEKITPSGQDVPGNPAVAVIDLAQGQVQWTTGATVCAVVLVLALVAAVFIAAALVGRRRAGKTRIDKVTKNLAGRRDVKSLSTKAVAKANQSRGDAVAATGVYIGREVGTGTDLWGGWEDLQLDLWGPRQGKTTSKVVPMILRAPGTVIATSCKRDVLDTTIAHRTGFGRVWVFDPQDKATGLDTSDWYFDPLDFVRRTQWWDGNAAELASIFDASARIDSGGDSTNAYFYQQATDLLAGLFVAATLDDRPITDVYAWVSDPTDTTAVKRLSSSQWDLLAADVASKYNAEPRTKSNVFSAAKNMISCLGRKQIARWMTPRVGADRFSPEMFAAADNETLYLLTDDENPVARPATSVLTVAVFKALVDRSDGYPRSRLPVPVSAPLDEIANVVAWPALPNHYSTWGSRGIIADAILQSYSQGVELWGETGMRKLFSAASIVVVGPGQKDYEFVDRLSNLIGTHTEVQRSISYNRGDGGRSISTSKVERQTITAAELSALPQGRMIVLAVGRRPMLARMVGWQDQDYTLRKVA